MEVTTKSRPAVRRGAIRTGLALVGALALIGSLTATPAAAAGKTDFGPPTASSSFGHGVTFAETVRFGGSVKRAEILVSGPDAIGPAVTEQPVTSSTSADLSYTVDASQGGMLPNTTLTARWRITYEDGSVDVGPSVSQTYADTRFQWKTTTGSVVRLHWYQGDDAFGARALKIGEQGIDNAAQLLGVTENAPVDFFVYADQQAFYDALGPGTRENVGGEAIPEIRTMFALITPSEIGASWVGIVIPHELTHLVFDTATKNPYHDPPHWLNEGLAVYLSQGFVASDRSLVADAVTSATLMPLSSLDGQFPTSADRFYLAYAESVSAIDFLIRTYGRPALVKLIRSYAGGVSDDAAFSAALGVDTAGFDAAWLGDLGAKEPRRYGPQPAPSGPLPSDWQGEAIGGGGGATPEASSGAGAPLPSATAGATPASPASTSGSSTFVLVLAALAVFAGLIGLVLLVRSQRDRTSWP